MTKKMIVLFLVLLVCALGKEIIETKSEERGDKNENNTDDDESASIQVVNRVLKNAEPQEENISNIHEDTTIPNDSFKHKPFYEDIVSDSDDLLLETTKPQPKLPTTTKIEEILIPSIEDNHDYNNRHEKLEIVIEHITKPYINHNENSHEGSLVINDEENIWRSAENDDSHEDRNDEASLDNDDYSGEGFMDKKFGLDLKGRMEPRQPARRERPMRTMNMRHYGPPDDRAMIDTPPLRSFGDLMAPRYRPVLTRNGIVYTPTLYSMQTPPPMIEQLHNHNWVNRPYINQGENNPRQRNRLRGLPHYNGDSKMIDDYNDYGSNTYSYTPMVKVTTQAPPQQILPPNKFDVFQKLVEASNKQKNQKRPYNDNEFPVNYYPQQYSNGYGPYDVRRIRRDAWDQMPFQER